MPGPQVSKSFERDMLCKTLQPQPDRRAGVARPDTPDLNLCTAHALGRNARHFKL